MDLCVSQRAVGVDLAGRRCGALTPINFPKGRSCNLPNSAAGGHDEAGVFAAVGGSRARGGRGGAIESIRGSGDERRAVGGGENSAAPSGPERLLSQAL